MNRPFYSEYVRHALRFYTRNLIQSRFKTDVDKHNWLACHHVIEKYSDRDRDIIVSVYGEYDTLPDNVYEAAKRHKINQSLVWDLMKEVERKIARKRGLL